MCEGISSQRSRTEIKTAGTQPRPLVTAMAQRGRRSGNLAILSGPVARMLTMDATLPGTLAVLVEFCLFCRRILANVLVRSVAKLGVYRNDGSRIDFIARRTEAAVG